MPTLKVTGRSFRYRGERYGRGDTFEADDGVLAKHPNTLSHVEDSDHGSVNEDGSTEELPETEIEAGEYDVSVEEIDPHPSDLKVGELEERLQDVDDAELVKAIKKAEKKSKDRSTAEDAIDARLAELEE